MKSNIQNLDGILDQSLKIAARVIAIVAFPALIIVAYRNIFLDFVPYHQLFLTICYGLFVFLGFGKIKSNQFRFYSLTLIFFALFIAAGLRNSSIIFVDVFLILACGLMAFKFTGLIVIISGIIATSALLLSVPETFLPDGEIYSSIIGVHLSCLTLSFVLIFAIRNVVEQYENVYLKEIEQNKSLIEKNKTSYDLVAEAQERSEAEKTKLKIAAYSLTSQMDLIKGLLESADQKKSRSQVENIRDRILDVSFNLSKISETGNYISNDTATLTLQDLAHILEKFAYSYELFSDEKGIKVEVETSSVSEVVYGIPLGSLKVMLHHLISYCQETYELQKLKFEISEGRRSQTMREVQFTVLASATGNLDDLNLARFNKVMESKLNFETGAPHTNLIKAVLSSLPGSIKATLIGNKVRMDISFWVELGEAA
jgi:hypothetical protein